MKTPKEIIREMRKFVADRSLNERTTFLGGVVKEWAESIEAAMREPVAEVRSLPGDICALDRNLPVGTPLFALPPDAAGEIERLTKRLNVAEMDRFEQGQEIERLKKGWRTESDKFIAELRYAYAEIERLKKELQRARQDCIERFPTLATDPAPCPGPASPASTSAPRRAPSRRSLAASARSATGWTPASI